MAPEGPYLDILTRTAIVALRSPFGNRTTKEIQTFLDKDISINLINATYKRAKDRGFDPNAPKLHIIKEMIEDAPRSGRLSI
jgi:hypothetical protein